MTKCDVCAEPAKWVAYAAYDVPSASPGFDQRLARYPAPMIRACASHFLEQMENDLGKPGTTGQFLVKKVLA